MLCDADVVYRRFVPQKERKRASALLCLRIKMVLPKAVYSTILLSATAHAAFSITGFTAHRPSINDLSHATHKTTTVTVTKIGTSPTLQNGVRPLFMFGGIFGSDDQQDSNELAKFSKLGSSDLTYESLSGYIQLWSKQFEENGGKGMGLTSPVRLLPASAPNGEEEKRERVVTASSGARLVFLPSKTGNAYASKKDEKTLEKMNNGAEAAPRNPPKNKMEGGIEIIVERLKDGEVRVRAERCDFDENTTIKEMSEEAILSKLKEAIGIWKKDH